MDKQYVIQQLAEQLSDRVLLEVFPQAEPESIRALLLDKDTSATPTTPAGADADKAQKVLTGCRLFTDGASRGNPGPAGAGVVVFDNKGRELATRAEYLGRCTNNVAEYQALILGLETAREIGCLKPAVFLDSELIVRQITGRYKVKNATLKPLFTRVRNLLKKFDDYSVTHVPRSQNSRADELANRGIDEKDRV